MSDCMDPEQEAKKDTRRAWKFILAALALVFGLFVGVMLFYDCPPPDDSSIMPKFTEPPGGRNPLAVFFDEVKGTSLISDLDHLSAESRSYTKGTNDEIKAFLSNQTVAMRAFEKLMLTDTSTWRWPGGEKRAALIRSYDDAKICQSIAVALKMKVRQHTEEENLSAALQKAIQIIRFGHGLQGAEGTVIDYLVAMTGATQGRQMLEEAMVSRNVNAELLASIQQELMTLEPKREDFIMTIKAECLFQKRSVEAIKREDPATINFTNRFYGISMLFLKPNLTQAIQVIRTKPLVEGLSVGWPEGWQASQKTKLESETFSKNWFRFWVSPNAFGNWMMMVSEPSVFTWRSRMVINVATARLTVLMLAIRRYELEQGRLPETLDGLVPQYLGTVPIDPFDGAPMRWNPTKKVIYSVGADGKDDHGKIDPRKKKRGQTLNFEYDVSMVYWWSEEAKMMREQE